MDAYKLEFARCKGKVVKAFPGLDVSEIVDLEPEGEPKGEEGGEATEEVTNPKAEQANAEEVSVGATTDEATIEVSEVETVVHPE